MSLISPELGPKSLKCLSGVHLWYRMWCVAFILCLFFSVCYIFICKSHLLCIYVICMFPFFLTWLFSQKKLTCLQYLDFFILKPLFCLNKISSLVKLPNFLFSWLTSGFSQSYLDFLLSCAAYRWITRCHTSGARGTEQTYRARSL